MRAVRGAGALSAGLLLAAAPWILDPVVERAAAEPQRTEVGSDFNGDGYADLAVAIRDESGNFDTAVVVLYGSPAGLRAQGRQRIPGKQDGTVLAVGNFDGDPYGDLVIADPTGRAGRQREAGRIRVLYGSPRGLDPGRVQVWHQGRPGVPGQAERGDEFGSALVSGNFGRGDQDDLAIASLGEGGRLRGTGSVTVLYGTSQGLEAAGSRVWTSDTAGVPGTGTEYEAFGTALAAGAFSATGYDDLAIGVPDQTVNGRFSAGAVVVLRGSRSGLTTCGSSRWTQDSPGVAGRAERFDWFGTSLAAGRFGGGARDALAVGVSGEGVAGVPDAGAVNILYGSAGGLGSSGNELISQRSRGIGGVPEVREFFGDTLAAGNVSGSGGDELIVGVNDSAGDEAAFSGQVHVVRFAGGRVAATGDQVLSVRSVGLRPQELEGFGSDLATARFRGAGQRHEDLAVVLSSEGGSARPEGNLMVFRGARSQVSTRQVQFWRVEEVDPASEYGLFGSLAAAGPSR